MRRKVCRGYVLVLVCLIFLGINVSFLWTQLNQVQQKEVLCDCKKVNNEIKDTPSSKDTPASVSLSQTHNVSRLGMPSPSEGVRIEKKNITTTSGTGNHELAVVVPFRDRFEEMMEFVPHIHSFLLRQNVAHRILVINQVDSHRFNRASLLNIGFLLSKNECDFMVMHDIDLLPLNDHLIYEFPSMGPFHVSSPELHPLYHYKTFVGGILIMSREQFEKVNGLSNLFWGWGREDDELYVRMKEVGMKVHYPQGITTGYRTFKHIHDKQKRPRDQSKNKKQWDMSRRRDRVTGVNSVKYKIVSNIKMHISGAPLNFISVNLDCDYKITPFCDNSS